MRLECKHYIDQDKREATKAYTTSLWILKSSKLLIVATGPPWSTPYPPALMAPANPVSSSAILA